MIVRRAGSASSSLTVGSAGAFNVFLNAVDSRVGGNRKTGIVGRLLMRA